MSLASMFMIFPLDGCAVGFLLLQFFYRVFSGASNRLVTCRTLNGATDRAAQQFEELI